MAILNPLTQQHCKDLDAVLQMAPHIRDTIKAYEECGLDCSQQKEIHEAQVELASAIKRKFNPLAE